MKGRNSPTHHPTHPPSWLDDQDGGWVSVSSGTGSPGQSWTKGRKTVVVDEEKEQWNRWFFRWFLKLLIFTAKVTVGGGLFEVLAVAAPKALTDTVKLGPQNCQTRWRGEMLLAAHWSFFARYLGVMLWQQRNTITASWHLMLSGRDSQCSLCKLMSSANEACCCIEIWGSNADDRAAIRECSQDCTCIIQVRWDKWRDKRQRNWQNAEC